MELIERAVALRCAVIFSLFFFLNVDRCALCGRADSQPTTVPATLPTLSTEQAARVKQLMAAISDTSQNAGRSEEDLIAIGPAAVPTVMRALSDANKSSNWGVLWRLNELMGKFGPSAVPEILQVSGGDWHIAFDALAPLRADARAAVPAMLADLKVRDKEQRLAILSLFGAMKQGAREAVPALIETLKDPDEFIRSSAAEALGYIGPRELVAPALLRCMKDPKPLVQGNAIAALKEVQYPVGSMESALLEAARSKDSGVRYNAFISLASASPASDAVIDVLNSAALRDPDKGARAEAVRSLGTVARKSDLARQTLLSLARDKDDDVRSVAGHALGDEGPSVVPLLAPLLFDPSLDVRKVALAAVERIGVGAEPLIPQLKVLLSHPDERIRHDAAGAIGEIGIGASSAAPAIAHLLLDRSPDVRCAALRALGNLGPAAFPHLNLMMYCMTDQDRDVRQALGYAFTSLETWSPPDPDGVLLKQFEQHLNDPDGTTRSTATRGLEMLGPAARPAIPLLLAAFRDGRLRLQDATVFRGIGVADPDVVALLINDIQRSPDAGFDTAVLCGILGELRPPPTAAVPLLIKAMSSDDSLMQWDSGYSLFRMGHGAVAVLPELDRMARESGSRGLFARVTAARCRGDESAALHLAIESLNDPLPQDWMFSTRNLAFAMVAQLAKDTPAVRDQAISVLSAPLNDSDYQTRLYAVGSLDQLGAAASTLPAIRQLLNDDNKYVRHAASVALFRIQAAK